jgi:hypothetical protein
MGGFQPPYRSAQKRFSGRRYTLRCLLLLLLLLLARKLDVFHESHIPAPRMNHIRIFTIHGEFSQIILTCLKNWSFLSFGTLRRVDWYTVTVLSKTCSDFEMYIFTNRRGVNLPKGSNLHQYLILRTKKIFPIIYPFLLTKKDVRLTTRTKLEKPPRRSVERPSYRLDSLLPTETMTDKTYDREESMLEWADKAWEHTGHYDHDCVIMMM